MVSQEGQTSLAVAPPQARLYRGYRQDRQSSTGNSDSAARQGSKASVAQDEGNDRRKGPSSATNPCLLARKLALTQEDNRRPVSTYPVCHARGRLKDQARLTPFGSMGVGLSCDPV
jgi:hypothetical protein